MNEIQAAAERLRKLRAIQNQCYLRYLRAWSSGTVREQRAYLAAECHITRAIKRLTALKIKMKERE